MSQTLYGYSQNYAEMTNNTVFVVESEKSVLQSHTYGLYNFVATGGNALSTTQCLALMELSPTSIVFMYDEGLDKSIILNNIKKMQVYTRMFDISVGYWDWEQDIEIDSKMSPTDMGKDKLQEIINNQIVYV